MTGHWKDPGTRSRLKGYFRALHTVAVLKQARIGLIGHAMQDMGDFCIDEAALLAQAGPRVEHIPADTLAELVAAAPASDVAAIMEKNRADFLLAADITPEEHRAAARVTWAMDELVTRHDLQAWSQYFAVLNAHPGIPCQPYLAASRLMGRGIPYGAEGDISAAAAGLLMIGIAGQASFTEMYTMDFDDRALFMRHIGEGNLSMARRDRPVRVIAKAPNGIGKIRPLTPVFALKPGPATLVSLTTGAHGRIKLVVAEGEILDTPEAVNMDSPSFKWRPDCGDAGDFLDRYCIAGGSHHQAIGFGHQAAWLATAARERLWECRQIQPEGKQT
jgi:L-arabinose isomerase